MSDLSNTAPAFVDVAHRIVWASVATVGDAPSRGPGCFTRSGSAGSGSR